jgi:hypothetical protein
VNQKMERGAGTHYTSTDLLHMKNSELDELFRTSGVGDIPNGVGRGTVLLVPGTFIAGFLAKLLYIIAWRGKVVDAANGTLKNIVTPIGVKAIKARVYKSSSWVDHSECIVLDYSKTSFVARWIRDEIREVAPGVFLGVVFWSRWKVAKFALVFPIS